MPTGQAQQASRPLAASPFPSPLTSVTHLSSPTYPASVADARVPRDASADARVFDVRARLAGDRATCRPPRRLGI